jgi:hypothetical protein
VISKASRSRRHHLFGRGKSKGNNIGVEVAKALATQSSWKRHQKFPREMTVGRSAVQLFPSPGKSRSTLYYRLVPRAYTSAGAANMTSAATCFRPLSAYIHVYICMYGGDARHLAQMRCDASNWVANWMKPCLWGAPILYLSFSLYLARARAATRAFLLCPECHTSEFAVTERFVALVSTCRRVPSDDEYKIFGP